MSNLAIDYYSKRFGEDINKAFIHLVRDADYNDPWDIMSTLRAFMAPYPTYNSIGEPPGLQVCDNDPKSVTYGKLVNAGQTRGLSIGPGLNAANMDSQGWLDKRRIRGE
jgi:hypothetical protein